MYNSPMFKAVLFDFDGTIVNTLLLYVKAYEKALGKFGFHFGVREIVDTCFGKTEEMICQKLGIPGHVEEFREIYFYGVKKFPKIVKLFPLVLKTLKDLRRHEIKLGVVSFAYRWYVDGMIEKLDLSKYFDLVMGFNDVKRPKPDPEIVLTSCRKFKVKPVESLVVGDAKSDIMMGKAAGCKTALFLPSDHKLIYDFDDLRRVNPDFSFEDYQEFSNIFLK